MVIFYFGFLYFNPVTQIASPGGSLLNPVSFLTGMGSYLPSLDTSLFNPETFWTYIERALSNLKTFLAHIGLKKEV